MANKRPFLLLLLVLVLDISGICGDKIKRNSNLAELGLSSDAIAIEAKGKNLQNTDTLSILVSRRSL